jgi:hypothetical protein
VVVIVDGNDEIYIRPLCHRPTVGKLECAAPVAGASRIARLLGHRG